MITCGGCNRQFSGVVLPEHDCDMSAFGKVGQDQDQFERDRISGLPMTPHQVEEYERQQDIAAMAKTRGPALVRAYRGSSPESLNNLPPRAAYTVTCEDCGKEFPTMKQWDDVPIHVCHGAPPQAVPDHRPGGVTMVDDLRRVAVRHEPEPPREVMTRQEISAVMAPMIREAFGELTGFLSEFRGELQDQQRLLKHIDVPLEAVANSHERASQSFETLRQDIFRGGLDKLEKVLDTSGLAEAASKSEQRIEALVGRLEKKIDQAFQDHAASMVQILHLLERLQARELRETKNRMQRMSKGAVRRGPKV